MSSSIQIEDGGFTRIHNTILEKLALTDLNGSEFRCLMFLFRKTYGYGKKEDKISLAQWADGIGIKQRNNVLRTLTRLKDRKIIYVIDHGPNRAQTWGFNKYFETWDTNQTVIQTDNSSDESVIESDNRCVIQTDNSFNPSVIQTDNKTVISLDNNKRKKESSSSTTREIAPEPSPPLTQAAAALDAEKELYRQFVKEYENTWGLLISSPYYQEKIEDWVQRIPLKAWQYGLKECADHRQVGQWKYLERILSRVERDGLQEEQPPPLVIRQTKTTFSLEEILQ